MCPPSQEVLIPIHTYVFYKELWSSVQGGRLQKLFAYIVAKLSNCVGLAYSKVVAVGLLTIARREVVQDGVAENS